MRFHNFFIKGLSPEASGQIIVEDKALLNQWKNVLRFRRGSELFLYDGRELKYRCVIEEVKKNRILLSVLEKINDPWEPLFDMELIQSLIKKDKFEWVLEKGTEIGVNKFSPIISERSIKQKINLSRAEKILTEACEQSGRSKLPEIMEIKSLEKALEERGEGRDYIVLDPKGKIFKKENLKNRKIGVFVGPEGGFSQSEVEVFEKNKIPTYSLGSQILRAETASISFSAVVLLGN